MGSRATSARLRRLWVPTALAPVAGTATEAEAPVAARAATVLRGPFAKCPRGARRASPTPRESAARAASSTPKGNAALEAVAAETEAKTLRRLCPRRRSTAAASAVPPASPSTPAASAAATAPPSTPVGPAACLLEPSTLPGSAARAGRSTRAGSATATEEGAACCFRWRESRWPGKSKASSAAALREQKRTPTMPRPLWVSTRALSPRPLLLLLLLLLRLRGPLLLPLQLLLRLLSPLPPLQNNRRGGR